MVWDGRRDSSRWVLLDPRGPERLHVLETLCTNSRDDLAAQLLPCFGNSINTAAGDQHPLAAVVKRRNHYEYSAEGRRSRLVKLLLGHGLCASDGGPAWTLGISPLALSIEEDAPSTVVEALVAANAQLDVPDILSMAISRPVANMGVIRCLLQPGRCSWGLLPLSRRMVGLATALCAKDWQFFDEHAEGEDLNCEFYDRGQPWTLLCYVLQHARSANVDEAVVHLLHYGVDVDLSPGAEIPLVRAVRTLSTAAVNSLLAVTDFVDFRKGANFSAIAEAVKLASITSVERLLFCGADLWSVTPDGKTLLQLALEADAWPMARMLIQHWANPAGALVTALRLRKWRALLLMVREGWPWGEEFVTELAAVRAVDVTQMDLDCVPEALFRLASFMPNLSVLKIVAGNPLRAVSHMLRSDDQLLSLLKLQTQPRHKLPLDFKGEEALFSLRYWEYFERISVLAAAAMGGIQLPAYFEAEIRPLLQHNSCSVSSRLALQIVAAALGRVDLVRLCHIPLSQSPEHSIEVLHAAARRGHVSVCDFVLSFAVPPAAHWLLASPNLTDEVVDVFVRHDVDVTSALRAATVRGLEHPENVARVRRLLSGWTAIDKCYPSGKTPLVLACELRCVTFAELLLAHGANPTKRVGGTTGPAWPPVWHACRSGCMAILDKLLSLEPAAVDEAEFGEYLAVSQSLLDESLMLLIRIA
jgi:hypothetical protein